MTLFHSIILGAIEGLTEFLPVSSTAHQVLIADLFKLPQTVFLTTFEIFIQLGAILAVVALYAKRFLADWETNKRIIVAFVPTAVIGFVLYKIIKGFFFEDTILILWMLLLGGAVLILFEAFHREQEFHVSEARSLSYRQAFLIGCAQSLAVIPGVSRAAATIVGGMLLGVRRRAIVEFSFLLAVPTMIAASGYDLYKSHAGIASGGYGMLAAGFLVAFVTAYFAVKFLLDYIKNHKFTSFGVYRIIFAIIFAFLLLR